MNRSKLDQLAAKQADLNAELDTELAEGDDADHARVMELNTKLLKVQKAIYRELTGKEYDAAGHA
jgi:hypothetical protein